MSETAHPQDKDQDKELLKILVERKIISEYQAQVASSDHEAMGISVADALMAHGWIKEESLKEVAPWLHAVDESKPAAGEDATYNENLKRYRQIMSDVLGENS
ncbi:MAG TPA: hypothetical protein V6D17_09575 [Candidatus Obscuribacterales bacterium]